MMVVYELHTLRDRAWKIDSVFDDRDLAVLEARRIERSKHYSGVRVLEETVDQATNRTVSRTIYRSSKIETPPAEGHQRRPQSASLGSAAKPMAAHDSATTKHPARHGNVRLVMSLTVGAILICGLGALYALTALTH